MGWEAGGLRLKWMRRRSQCARPPAVGAGLHAQHSRAKPRASTHDRRILASSSGSLLLWRLSGKPERGCWTKGPRRQQWGYGRRGRSEGERPGKVRGGDVTVSVIMIKSGKALFRICASKPLEGRCKGGCCDDRANASPRWCTACGWVGVLFWTLTPGRLNHASKGLATTPSRATQRQ